MEPKLHFSPAVAEPRNFGVRPAEPEATAGNGDAFRQILAGNLFTEVARQPEAPTTPAITARSEPSTEAAGTWSPLGAEEQPIETVERRDIETTSSENAEPQADLQESEELAVQAGPEDSSGDENAPVRREAESKNEEIAEHSGAPNDQGTWLNGAAGLLSRSERMEPSREPADSKPSTAHTAADLKSQRPAERGAVVADEVTKGGAAAGSTPAQKSEPVADFRPKGKNAQTPQSEDRPAKSENLEKRAAETVAAIQAQKHGAKSEERRTQGNVEVDASRWKVHAEAGASESARSQNGRSDSQQQSAQHGEESRRKATIKTAELRTEESDRTAPSVLRRTVTMTELASDLRPAAGRTATEAETNRQRFSELIDRARVNLGRDGKSSASIQLNPQHLGRMTLNLELHEGRLQAKVLVDNPEAERALKQEMEGLRRELKAHGIALETFSVKVREPGASFESRPDQENQSGFGQTESDHGHSRQKEARQDPESPSLARYANGPDSRRDIYDDHGSFERNEESLLNVSA